jgi:hypothetical protein
MDLYTTHITGKFESLSSTQRTQDVNNTDGFAHVDLSFSRCHEVQVMENIIGGNLLYDKIMPGLEGDFYFVEFDNQQYLVGFKDESRSFIDEALFQAIIPRDKEASELEKTQNEIVAMFRLWRVGNIVEMIFLYALAVALFGAVFFRVTFFRLMLLILILGLILVSLYLGQIGRKLDKHNQKNKKILDEINRSHSLLVQEMQRKLNNIMA